MPFRYPAIPPFSFPNSGARTKEHCKKTRNNAGNKAKQKRGICKMHRNGAGLPGAVFKSYGKIQGRAFAASMRTIGRGRA